jgi:N12 class adenine-specific DNA methylase
MVRVLPQQAVETFLDDYFTHDSKIHLSQLLRWTTKNRSVLDYFQQIGYEVDQPP